MNKFLVSEEAYKEFKAFLDENEVEKYSIRINLAGFGCSGPAFNITVDEANENDVVETMNDITFIAESKLVDEFGGLDYFLLKKMTEEDYLLNQLSKLLVDAVLAEAAAVTKKECF